MNFAEAQEKRKYRSNFFKKKNGRGVELIFKVRARFGAMGWGEEKLVLR